MLEKEKLKNGFAEIFKKGKASKIIVVLGLIGMVLIFLSGIKPEKNTPAVPEVSAEESFSTEEDIEKKIRDIVESIKGAGRAKVMVTFAGGSERIYAKSGSESRENFSDGEESRTVTEKEEDYVTVENDNGKKQALLLGVTAPEVKGVVVVCEGGADPRTEARVVGAVTTALGISSTKVFVTALAD